MINIFFYKKIRGLCEDEKLPSILLMLVGKRDETIQLKLNILQNYGTFLHLYLHSYARGLAAKMEKWEMEQRKHTIQFTGAVAWKVKGCEIERIRSIFEIGKEEKWKAVCCLEDSDQNRRDGKKRGARKKKIGDSDELNLDLVRVEKIRRR